MRTILRRLPWRKKPTRTATEEYLEEVKEQGHKDDTDTGEVTGGGADDPITPSRYGNRNTGGGTPLTASRDRPLDEDSMIARRRLEEGGRHPWTTPERRCSKP